MSEPIDLDQMRANWPIDDQHRATKNPNHCDTCNLRMPCDWSLVVVDVHLLADEIEHLQAQRDRTIEAIEAAVESLGALRPLFGQLREVMKEQEARGRSSSD